MKYCFIQSHILLFLGFLLIFSCKSEPGENARNSNTAQVQTGSMHGIIIEINSEELLQLLKYDKNAFVIDVRKADKSIRSCKRIEGYRHLEDSLIYKKPEILPKGKSIVLLSKDGIRSRKIGEFLAKKGHTIYNLKGGMDSYWRWRDKIIRKKLNIYDKEINVIELYADDFGC